MSKHLHRTDLHWVKDLHKQDSENSYTHTPVFLHLCRIDEGLACKKKFLHYNLEYIPVQLALTIIIAVYDKLEPLKLNE